MIHSSAARHPALMRVLRAPFATYFLFFLFAFSTAAQTDKITAAEAKDHVGEN